MAWGSSRDSRTFFFLRLTLPKQVSKRFDEEQNHEKNIMGLDYESTCEQNTRDGIDGTDITVIRKNTISLDESGNYRCLGLCKTEG
jgi:hypothetical protein